MDSFTSTEATSTAWKPRLSLTITATLIDSFGWLKEKLALETTPWLPSGRCHSADSPGASGPVSPARHSTLMGDVPT